MQREPDRAQRHAAGPPQPAASRRAAPPGAGRSSALARAVASGAALSNRGVARVLARDESGGYGYEFSDDPLNAGGFGPNDATIRVKPGPVRTTLIRPRPPAADPDPLKLKVPPPVPAPSRDWVKNALERDPVLKLLPPWAREKAIDALKDADEMAADAVLDALPLDDRYKEAAKSAVKALLKTLKGERFTMPPAPPATRVPDWGPSRSLEPAPGEMIFKTPPIPLPF